MHLLIWMSCVSRSGGGQLAAIAAVQPSHHYVLLLRDNERNLVGLYDHTALGVDTLCLDRVFAGLTKIELLHQVGFFLETLTGAEGCTENGGNNSVSMSTVDFLPVLGFVDRFSILVPDLNVYKPQGCTTQCHDHPSRDVMIGGVSYRYGNRHRRADSYLNLRCVYGDGERPSRSLRVLRTHRATDREQAHKQCELHLNLHNLDFIRLKRIGYHAGPRRMGSGLLKRRRFRIRTG